MGKIDIPWHNTHELSYLCTAINSGGAKLVLLANPPHPTSLLNDVIIKAFSTCGTHNVNLTIYVEMNIKANYSPKNKNIFVIPMFWLYVSGDGYS